MKPTMAGKRMKRQAENHIIQKAPTYKIQTKEFYINTKTHGEVLKRIMRNTSQVSVTVTLQNKKTQYLESSLQF